ncbi:fungal transcription factor [Stemphylium lycopersici]|uniref:Fungal transcription factor n=1 Tax=Stemphylium lycopersici TaxID=183478 RepID=A0A364NFB6_STELY|nr:hypothetical protein TW65_08541 [Stemphylium lycopersici]RAR06520.1 fungal transcription factor [Stemphylium lycopersici]RAR15801.1 fungal transcription factor [Stemphylium lycopersici]
MPDQPTFPPPNDPVSPISSSSSTSFPHKTSLAATTQTPRIDTNTRAINDVPIELDGGAGVSVEEFVKRRRDGEGGIRGFIRSPDEEGIDAEFLSEGGDATREGREKRAAMLASRSKDPGVIVDVPQEPTAEEVEAARKADALVAREAVRT